MKRALIYIFLLITSLFFLLPGLGMFLTSLKSLEEIRTGDLLTLPLSPLNFSAWKVAWNQACIGVQCQGLRPFFSNSLMMAIPSVLFSTFLGSLNGYALTQWRFKGSQPIFLLLLFGCFIPYQAIVIPLAMVLSFLNLQNSITGLVLVHTVYGISFTTLYFRNYYLDIPRDLVKAAQIDGAGFFTLYREIILPLSLPMFMVSFIWQFTAIWNDFLFGLVLTSGDKIPIMVALNNLVSASTGTKAYNVDMAASLISAFPTFILYVVAGKFFIRGLTAGAVKG